MTKRREQQARRQKSRAEQALTHDKMRKDRAWAIYEYGSIEKMIDEANDRWFSEPGSGTPPPPLGPNYKQKKRQKNTVKADAP